jgi:xylulokinase
MIFLGIDMGPHGTRVIALDMERATVVAEGFAAHRWIDGLPDGYREQEPLEWLQAVDAAMRMCLSLLGTERENVVALAVGSGLQGMVVMDGANRIARPAKLAGDFSAKRQAEEIARAYGGAPGLIEMVGNPFHADDMAAQCLWLKQHEPYHFQRARWLLPVKDFINYWLTGEIGTDAGMASGTGLFDVRQRRWSAEMASFIDAGLAGLLPPVNDSLSPCGRLREPLAKGWGLDASVLVSQGSGAPMFSCLASASMAAGSISLELGSSGVLSGIAPQPCVDLRGEVSALCDATGRWLAHVITANAVAAPEMLRRHHGWTADQWEQMILEGTPGAEGLLLLPYVTGEKTPCLPEASGVLHGITLENFTPANLARATAEGVAFGLGYGLGRIRELGFEPDVIQISGAGAQSAAMRQLLADVFGIPVVGLSSPQGAAFGAAIHAALVFFHHSGEALRVENMAQYLVSVDADTRCEPRSQNHELYQELISRQQYLVDTLHPAGFL